MDKKRTRTSKLKTLELKKLRLSKITMSKIVNSYYEETEAPEHRKKRFRNSDLFLREVEMI